VNIFPQKFFALKVGLGQEELQGINPESFTLKKKQKEEENFWSFLSARFLTQKVHVRFYVITQHTIHDTLYHTHHHAVLPERASLAALLLPPSVENIHQRKKCSKFSGE